MKIYTREEWGSLYPRGGYLISNPVQESYIHHFNSGITPPKTVADAMARVRGAQHYHAVTNGWGDIGYSWLADDLGNLYEGRGWWRTGAHTSGYNSKGYGICWLGDSTGTMPSTLALGAMAEIIRIGITVGAISPFPTVVSHRDRNPGETACPGALLYTRMDDIRKAVVKIEEFGNTTKRKKRMIAVRTPDQTMWNIDGIFAMRIQTGLNFLKHHDFISSDPEWGIPVDWHEVDDFLVAMGDGQVMPMRDFRTRSAAALAAQQVPS